MWSIGGRGIGAYLLGELLEYYFIGIIMGVFSYEIAVRENFG